MSTLVAAPFAADPRIKRRPDRRAVEGGSALVGALLVLLIHGYHPYSSDGSIYVTGIQKALSPQLYAGDDAFVRAQAQLSIFSDVAARAIAMLHVPLDLFLFISYFLLTALTLMLAARLGCRLWNTGQAGWGAMALLVVCYPIPVAATSLLLADPYITARSASTPLTLLALLAASSPDVRRSRSLATTALYTLLAALFHPLMGVYLLLFLSVFFLVRTARWRMVIGLSVGVFAVGAALHFARVGIGESAAYREAVASRDCYFLAHWEWYEKFGLVAPLALLTGAWYRLNNVAGQLALTCVIVGGICTLTSVCFVHPAQADLLMRIQLLRSFHTVYLLGAIFLGSALAVSTPPRLRVPLAGLLIAVAVGMYLNERATYLPVSHLEAPEAFSPRGSAALDSWQKAFSWVRTYTPATASFAIDPRFMHAQGESMPGFRAVAQRSILTDVKDEGPVSLFPKIAPAWSERRDLETDLDRLTDAERRTRLLASGVNWLLLSPTAITTLPCPFRNPAVQVCSIEAPPRNTF